jgi:membrane-associated phospholipid phosphatase
MDRSEVDTDKKDSRSVKSISKSSDETGISLPLFVTKENKLLVGAVTFVVAAAVYLMSNHFPIFEPRMLPMTVWDQAIPFVPQTVWIYASEYIYFIVIYWLCRETLNMNRYVYAVLAIQFVSVAIFWVWPTTYPRNLFPLPDSLDPLTHWLFASIREGDSPNNCAPSLHVSSVLLCAFLFFNEQREKLWFFLTWGALISLSTLTTKQHYIVDVVSGLMMAILFHWLFYRRIAYHEPRAARAATSTAS